MLLPRQANGAIAYSADWLRLSCPSEAPSSWWQLPLAPRLTTFRQRLLCILVTHPRQITGTGLLLSPQHRLLGSDSSIWQTAREGPRAEELKVHAGSYFHCSAMKAQLSRRLRLSLHMPIHRRPVLVR